MTESLELAGVDLDRQLRKLPNEHFRSAANAMEVLFCRGRGSKPLGAHSVQCSPNCNAAVLGNAEYDAVNRSCCLVKSNVAACGSIAQAMW